MEHKEESEFFYKSASLDRCARIIDRLSVFGMGMKCFSVVFIITAMFYLNPVNTHLLGMLLFAVPLFSLWCLDGYFLWQERLMRCVFTVIQGHKGLLGPDIRVTPKSYSKGRNRYIPSLCSRTLVGFHFSMFVMLGLLYFINHVN